ncbi:DUF1801 domain-containing protein [Sporolactobacillus kofuensis]|uniref:DUF1801 domain-containing protein n=1 Tax=Sporolactobacillus kofuensis TaxID=269672 RepID=A0ABW1WFV4_9BACL|nr:DUF1801 domain-containing protein [Sporolactobacillus kofuensis]MCO7175818.1 DUF1801 domain-containing protein [Sporolactobacillus kofuensis]
MGYELKMKENENSVTAFIEKVESVQKKADAYRLLDLFTEVTGHPAKMWGPSIIGFGAYHYNYASGHEGDAPLTGFSPRKAKISLYLTMSEDTYDIYAKDLGKHTRGKSCTYINKLADINQDVLKKLIVESVQFLKKQETQ